MITGLVKSHLRNVRKCTAQLVRHVCNKQKQHISPMFSRILIDDQLMVCKAGGCYLWWEEGGRACD